MFHNLGANMRQTLEDFLNEKKFLDFYRFYAVELPCFRAGVPAGRFFGTGFFCFKKRYENA